MLAPLSEVLDALPDAAVGSFNLLDFDMAVAILEAAEELQVPVVLGMAARHWSDFRGIDLAPALLSLAERAAVPVALHLDHANPTQMEMIREALALGFTSIMLDGSALGFEENAEATRAAVALCEPYPAEVEGELGAIAGEEGVPGEVEAGTIYTAPAEAARFAEETGIQALALAVGTAHGFYKAEPKLSLETISATRALTDIPLVLHGATGLADDAIRGSVKAGIRKINFFSGLLAAAMQTCRERSPELGNHFAALKLELRARWRACAREQMALYALRPASQP